MDGSRWRLWTLAVWAAGACGLALLTIVVVTPLDLTSQACLGAAVFAASLVLRRFGGERVTLALVLVSITVSSRYLYWRVSATIGTEWSIDVAVGVLLLLAETYSFVMLLLGYLQSVRVLRRHPVPLPEDTAAWPTVDVFIPTYNEPLRVVRATVLAAKAMDWPSEKLNVYVLDDGRRPEFRAFAAAAGVGYVVRPDNKHAKAGNLNHALGKTRGELVAIFDCDHVPCRSFLQVTVGAFLCEPKLAMVQTPHHFYSPDPFERNLGTFRSVPNEGELFYRLIQPANDVWNAVFFCGSCAVLRRSALLDVGGIAVETVTEDAHTALKMHRRGWTTAFLEVAQAAGLATESLSAHVGQRIRWARGMAQIFRIDNPLLGRGLTLGQRLSYAAAMLHFFAGIPRLVFLVIPLAYLLFGLEIFNAPPLLALSYGLPHLMHAVATNSRIQRRFRHSFWSEVYEAALAFYLSIPTTLALINPKAGRFNVTAKGGRIESAYFDRRIARPYLVLLALNLLGLAVGLSRLWLGRGEPAVVAMNLAWTAYNLVILAACCAVAWEQRQVRESPRVRARLPAMLRLDTGRTVRCETIDLSRGGVALAVPQGRALSRHQKVSVSLFHQGEERPLPAEVVAQDGGVSRLRFLELDLEQESWLVEAIFSRADAWARWDEGRPADRPLRSLGSIVLHGVRGVVQSARSIRPLPPVEIAPGIPAIARSRT